MNSRSADHDLEFIKVLEESKSDVQGIHPIEEEEEDSQSIKDPLPSQQEEIKEEESRSVEEEEESRSVQQDIPARDDEKEDPELIKQPPVLEPKKRGRPGRKPKPKPVVDPDSFVPTSIPAGPRKKSAKKFSDISKRIGLMLEFLEKNCDSSVLKERKEGMVGSIEHLDDFEDIDQCSLLLYAALVQFQTDHQSILS
jgi:hypothetical protein